MKKINEENSPFDFIINTLKEWEKKFPNIKVYYGYDEEAQIHDIIVQPESIWDNALFQETEDNFFWNELPKRFQSINLTIGFADCEDISDMDNILYTNMTEQ